MENNSCYVSDLFGDGSMFVLRKESDGTYNCCVNQLYYFSSKRLEVILLVLSYCLDSFNFRMQNKIYDKAELSELNVSINNYCLACAFNIIKDTNLDEESLVFRKRCFFDPAVELLNLNKFGRSSETVLQLPNETNGINFLKIAGTNVDNSIYWNDEKILDTNCKDIPCFVLLNMFKTNDYKLYNLFAPFINIESEVDKYIATIKSNNFIRFDSKFYEFIEKNLNSK